MARSKRYKPRILYFSGELERKLERLRHYPLTVVEAPSGFGKTTALRHFFSSPEFHTVPVHWLTYLGEPAGRFWSALCGVLADIDPAVAAALSTLNAPCAEDIPWIGRHLANLVCPGETYLILDNFSGLDLGEKHALISALAGQGGKGLHIVAVTTQVAGVSYPMIQSSMVYHLFTPDFTFSERDTHAYFQAVGLRLTEREVREVHASTDGWAAALYLQMLAYLDTGHFSRSDMDGLFDRSLWRRLTPEVKRFFLALSVAPRFTLDQAVHMTGVTREKASDLLRDNGFINFDAEGKFFYFHTIFAAALAERFAALSQDACRDIYLRAGEWAERTEDRFSMLRFYYHAGAFERLFSNITTSYDAADVMDETTEPIILDLLERTPKEIKVRYPQAMLSLVLTLFFMGRNDELLRRRAEIERLIGESALGETEKNALRGEMELLLSFLEYNRIDAMSLRHRKALRLLGGPARLISVRSTWTFGAPSVLYMFWRESGRLEEELGQMDDCMPVYYRLTGGHGTGAESVMRAEAALLRGDLELGEILCHKALLAAEGKRQSSICQCGLFLLARIALLRGDRNLFEEALTGLEERADQHTEDLCRYTLDLAHGFLGVTLGRQDMLAGWIAAGEIDQRRLVVMTMPFAYIIYARLLLLRGEYRRLLGAGEHFLELSSLFPNLLPQVYLLLYMAVARERTGSPDQADALLAKALALALPDRVYLPFAENGDALAPLLARAGVPEEELAAINGLAARMAAAVRDFGPRSALLTPREREIVLLARDRLTSRQIGSRLHLGESTVKNALSRAYEKLEIHSRAELQELDL